MSVTTVVMVQNLSPKMQKSVKIISNSKECRKAAISSSSVTNRHPLLKQSPQNTAGKPNMAEGESGLAKPVAATPYDEALDALSTLITKRSRADKSNNGDRFDLLYDYLKILDLDEAISQMKIIHVAGTKGKGSTCAFTEAILRNYGFPTGLFTSPHLIDVRERFRLDGVDISEEKFLAYFWWCYDRLKEALLEKLRERRLQGVPAFTVPQPYEAMRVLEEKAFRLNVHLQVAQPLDRSLLNGLKLGLDGEHQYVNAGLAITVSSTWLQKTGHLGTAYFNQTSSLPEQFIEGLTTASLQGRAQIVPDGLANTESPGDLVFYLDGAHSPESMEACARWFSIAIKEENQQNTLNGQAHDHSGSSNGLTQWHTDERSRKSTVQILLFNCMSVRDPQLLLPRLMTTCADHGVYFKKALFVPNISVYYKVGPHTLPPSDSQVDFSWQFALQRVWENLMQGDKGEIKNAKEICVRSCKNSAVFSSLPSAIKWLRNSVQQTGSSRFQVLVTGPCSW